MHGCRQQCMCTNSTPLCLSHGILTLSVKILQFVWQILIICNSPIIESVDSISRDGLDTSIALALCTAIGHVVCHLLDSLCPLAMVSMHRPAMWSSVDSSPLGLVLSWLACCLVQIHDRYIAQSSAKYTDSSMVMPKLTQTWLVQIISAPLYGLKHLLIHADSLHWHCFGLCTCWVLLLTTVQQVSVFLVCFSS